MNSNLRVVGDGWPGGSGQCPHPMCLSAHCGKEGRPPSDTKGSAWTWLPADNPKGVFNVFVPGPSKTGVCK